MGKSRGGRQERIGSLFFSGIHDPPILGHPHLPDQDLKRNRGLRDGRDDPRPREILCVREERQTDRQSALE
jgi:hypothetical protein